MTTVDQMIARIEAGCVKTNTKRVHLNGRGKWVYFTLGCTVSKGFNTELAATKHMNKADADSRYWEGRRGGNQ